MLRQTLNRPRPEIWIRFAVVAGVVLGFFAIAHVEQAATADDVYTNGEEPIAVIASAGIDRLLEDIDYVFEAAERPQIASFIRGFAQNINNFEGLNRDAPIGMYLYPRENLPGEDPEEPAGVLFIPVTDVDRLVETLRISNQVFLERTDDPEIIELHTPEETHDLRVAHDHLFFNFEALPLKTFPNPDDLIGDNAEQYDLYIDLRKAGLRPEFIERIASQITSQVEADLDRKPSESDAEYAIRRRAAETFRDFAVEIVRSGEHLVAGISLGEDHAGLAVNWELRLASGSWLIDALNASSLTASHFRSQLAEPEPATFSMSWQLPADAREMLLDGLAIGYQQALDNADDDGGRHVIEQLYQTVQATAEAGKFDLFGQMIGEPPQRLVFVGGLAIAGDDVLAETLAQVLPFAANAPQVRELEMNIGRAGEVAIHKVVPSEMRQQEQRLYGEDAAFYFGVGDGAIWLAVGEDHALDILTDVIESRDVESTREGSEPHLQFALHLSDWVVLADTLGNGNNDQRRFFEAAREAFANPDDDLLEFSIRPSDNGLRAQLHLDEGYIRLFGIAVANQINR